MKRIALTIAATVVLSSALITLGADWPQFRGPNRDGKSGETGLLKSWPEGGPKLLWTSDVDLGKGFSSISLAKGTIYTTGMIDGQETMFALDLKGKLKWKTAPYGPAMQCYMPGARTIPTVDGDNIYVMSSKGKVTCFLAADGKEKWSVDTAAKFGAKVPRWGIAESILIIGDLAICTPGGPDATMVALNKLTGKTVWQAKSTGEMSAYCSPILIKDDKKNLIVTMTEKNVIGVNAADGKVFWKFPYSGRCQAHPISPTYSKGRIFITSGYNDGSVMLDLADDGKSVKVAWKDKGFDTHHGGVILVDGYLYGTTWNGNGDGNWICAEWKKGEVQFDKHWKCKGAMVFADGMLYCYEEKGGTVGLVKASPSGFKVISSFKVTKGDGKHWAHPVVAGGVLYIRHGSALMAYDIKGK
ncbi:MAG: PQQ-binding-like beta-propeller repeat protein [Phycisphaerae bacterium]|nr:PQQ-binding-like beta-propeller repeat protein [Phycisphaerae bacterium]